MAHINTIITNLIFVYQNISVVKLFKKVGFAVVITVLFYLIVYILPSIFEYFTCSYVETLICSLLPPEVQKEAEPKEMGENIKKDTRKSRSLSHSSVKSKKKKPKSKKK